MIIKQETKNNVNKERIFMINTEYKEWIIKHWLLENGLITQAIAAKILDKTPTRIRQMINENKIKSFLYKKETPLVSMREVLQIYEKEYQKELEIEREMHESQLTDLDKAQIEFEEEERRKEYEEHMDLVYQENAEEIEAQKEYHKIQEKKYQELRKKRDEMEEEIAIMERSGIGQS